MWELLQNLMSIKEYILKSDFKEQTNLAKTWVCNESCIYKKTPKNKLARVSQEILGRVFKQETDKLNLFPVSSLGTFC